MSKKNVSDAAGEILDDNNCDRTPPESQKAGAAVAADDAGRGVAEVAAVPSCERPIGGALPESVTLALEAKELSLTPQQETALILMSAGRPQTEVAYAVGVSRQTLNRWIKGNAAFAVAYNTWLEDSRATARAQLVKGLGTAMERVLRKIR